MKITHVIAAGLLVAGVGVSASAEAQDYRGGYGYRDHDRRSDYRRDYRDDYRDGHRWGHDRGRHYGWRNHYRPHCRTVWRYNHRVRICR